MFAAAVVVVASVVVAAPETVDALFRKAKIFAVIFVPPSFSSEFSTLKAISRYCIMMFGDHSNGRPLLLL